jgi:hypothetical protein
MTNYSDMDDDEEEEHERGRQSLLDTKVPQQPQSPFTDAAAVERPGTSGTLKPDGEKVERGKSPFADPEDVAVAVASTEKKV